MESEDFSIIGKNVFNDPSHEKSTSTIMMNKGSGEYTMVVTNSSDQNSVRALKKINNIATVKAQTSVNESLSTAKKNPKILPGPAPSTSKTLPTTALLVKNQMPMTKKIVAVTNPYGTKMNSTNVLKKQIIQLDRMVGEQKQGQAKQDMAKVVPKQATIVGSPSLISKSNAPPGVKILYKNNAGNLVFTPAPGSTLPSLAPKPSSSTSSTSFPLISISKPECSPISISQSSSKSNVGGIQLTPVTYVSGQVSPGHIRLTVPAAKILGSTSTISTGKFVNGPTIKVVRSGTPGIPLLTTMAKTVPSGLVSSVSTVKTVVSGSTFSSAEMKTIAVTQVTNMGKPKTIEIIKPLLVAGKAKENSILLTPVTAPSEVPKKSSPKDDKGKESSLDLSEFFIINKDTDRRSPSGFGITKSPIEPDEVLEIVSPENKPSVQDISDSKCITEITPDSPPGVADMKIVRAHYSDLIAQCLHKFSALVLKGALSLGQCVETLALLLDRVATSPLGAAALGDKAFFVSLKRRLQNVNLINQLSFIMNNMNLVCANLSLNRVSSHFLGKLNAFRTFAAEWTRDATSREWRRASARLTDLCESPCMTDAASLRHDLQSFFLNVTTFMESVVEDIKDIVKKFINYLKEGLGLSLAKGSVMQSARYASDEIYRTFVLLNKEKTRIERTYRGIMARSGAAEVPAAARDEVITIEEEEGGRGSPDCVQAARLALDANKKKIVEATAQGMDVSRRIMDATVHVWDVSKRMTEATTKTVDVANQDAVGVARENVMLSVAASGEETGEIKRILLKKPETPGAAKPDDTPRTESKPQESTRVETGVREALDSLCEELPAGKGPVETSSFKERDTLMDIFEPSPEKNETNLSDDYNAFVISSEEEEDVVSASVAKESEIEESATEPNVVKREEKPVKKYMSPMEQFVEKYRASSVAKDASVGKLYDKINEIGKQNSAKRCAGNIENVPLKQCMQEVGNPKDIANPSHTEDVEKQQNSEGHNVIGNRISPSISSALSIEVNTGTTINLDSSINKISPKSIHPTSVTIISSSHSPTTIEHVTLKSTQKSLTPASSDSVISIATTTVTLPTPSLSSSTSSVVSQSGVPQGSTLGPLISQSQTGVSHESSSGSVLSLSSSNFSSPTITVNTKSALSTTPVSTPNVSSEGPVTPENSVTTVKKFPHPELFEEIKQLFTREQKTLDNKLSKSALLNKSSKTMVYTRKVTKHPFVNKKLPEAEDDVTIIDTKLSHPSNQPANKSKAPNQDGVGSKELDNGGDSLKVRNVQRINDLSCDEVFVEETIGDRGKRAGEKFICLFDLAAEESVNKVGGAGNSSSSSGGAKTSVTPTTSSESETHPSAADEKPGETAARLRDGAGSQCAGAETRRSPMSDEDGAAPSPSLAECEPNLPESRRRLRLLRQRYLSQQRDQALETACLAGMKAQAMGFRVASRTPPVVSDAAAAAASLSSDGTASGPDDPGDGAGCGVRDAGAPLRKRARKKQAAGGIRPLSRDLVMGAQHAGVKQRAADDVIAVGDDVRRDRMGNRVYTEADFFQCCFKLKARGSCTCPTQHFVYNNEKTGADSPPAPSPSSSSGTHKRKRDDEPAAAAASSGKRRKAKAQPDPGELFRCESCGCYGDLSEFVSERFCSDECQVRGEAARGQTDEAEKARPPKERRPAEELSPDDAYRKAAAQWSWRAYYAAGNGRPAPFRAFRNEPANLDRNPFRRGHKMEAKDPHMEARICVATCVEVKGPRIRLHFDDYSDRHDFWTNAASPDLYPAGWNAQFHRRIYPPPTRAGSFSWRKYLAVTGATAAPAACFTCSHMPPSVFKIKHKLEAVNKKGANKLHVATVRDVIGPRVHIHLDGLSERYDYWTDIGSVYIRPVGYCSRNNKTLVAPPGEKNFNWDTYLNFTNSDPVPEEGFLQSPLPNAFEKGQKVEAVDPRVTSLIRVATVVEVDELKIKLSLDGFPPYLDYWIYYDSVNVHPPGWCERSGHPLEPPVGGAIAAGPCGTPGCAGRGHVDRSQTSHTTAATCPYSPANYKTAAATGGEASGGGGGWERIDRETEPLLAPLVETRRKYGGDAGRTEPPGRECRLSSPMSLLDEDSCGGVSTLSGGDGEASEEEELNVVDVTRERGGGGAHAKRNLLKRQASSSKSSHSSGSAVPKPSAPAPPGAATAARLDALREAMVRSLYSAMPRGHAPATSHYWAQHAASSLGLGAAERPDPVNWSEAEVAAFVRAIPDCEPLASEFQKLHLDGPTFLLLSQSDLQHILRLKMGHALKIYNAILLLRQKSQLMRSILFSTLDKEETEEKTEEKEDLKHVSEDKEEVKREMGEEIGQEMTEMKEELKEEMAELGEAEMEGLEDTLETPDPLRTEETSLMVEETDPSSTEEFDPLSIETSVKEESDGVGGALSARASDGCEENMASDVNRAICDVKDEVASDVNRDVRASDVNMEDSEHNETLSEGVKEEVDCDEYSDNPLRTDVKSERLSTELGVDLFVDNEPVVNSSEIVEKSLVVDSFKLVDNTLADTDDTSKNVTEERKLREENDDMDAVTDDEAEDIMKQMEFDVAKQLGIDETVTGWDDPVDSILLCDSQEVGSKEVEVSGQDDDLADAFDLFDNVPSAATSAPKNGNSERNIDTKEDSDSVVEKEVPVDKAPYIETEKTLCEVDDVIQKVFQETDDTDINEETDRTVQENNVDRDLDMILSPDKPSSSSEEANEKGLPMDID